MRNWELILKTFVIKATVAKQCVIVISFTDSLKICPERVTTISISFEVKIPEIRLNII
jgi:hypothetical protein